MYPQGGVDDLVKALGCEGISKSQVSRICQELDVVVDGFMGRPLDGGPYPYLWLDALTQKVREAGRIVNVSVVVATAVMARASGRSSGWTWVRVKTAPSGWPSYARCPPGASAGWNWWYRTLIRDSERHRRSLRRSQLATVPHPLHDHLLTRVPRRAQPWVATMVRTIYQQPSPDEVHAQLDRVTDQLQNRSLRSPLYWTRPDPTSWPSPTSHSPTGRRSGPTTHRSVSTRRSGDAPMWWASSLTGRPCAASLAPSWLSSTTNGPLAVDTSHLSC